MSSLISEGTNSGNLDHGKDFKGLKGLVEGMRRRRIGFLVAWIDDHELLGYKQPRYNSPLNPRVAPERGSDDRGRSNRTARESPGFSVRWKRGLRSYANKKANCDKLSDYQREFIKKEVEVPSLRERSRNARGAPAQRIRNRPRIRVLCSCHGRRDKWPDPEMGCCG